MARKFLWTQYLLIGLAFSIDQTCVWKDGSIAQGYAPCTNSSASTGNCCSIGDVCTYNGMCYGGVGLVYRGACINEWGDDCLTYCDDISANWANFYPCAYANTGSSWGPQNWWCGPMGTNICTNDTGSHFVQMAPSVGVKLLSSATSSSASPTGKPTGTTTQGASTTSSNVSKSSSPAASSTTNNGAMIGLGVGLGVVVIACAVAGLWLLRSYRRSKAQFKVIQAGPPQQEYYPPSFKADINAQGADRIDMTGFPPSTELDTQRRLAPVELENSSR